MNRTDARFTTIFATEIAALYRETNVPRPTKNRSIAPLGDLLRGLCLARTEIADLTSRKAEEFLLRWGGLSEGRTPAGWSNDTPLAGFLYAGAEMGSLFVERTDMVVRRRFSAAHELGHYVLHFCPLLRASKDDRLALTGLTDAFIGPEDEAGTNASLSAPPEATSHSSGELPPAARMEWEANAFAAALLMPADVVRALVQTYRKDFRGEDLVWRLAAQMLVSRWAIRRRLNDLSLFVSETENDFRGRN